MLISRAVPIQSRQAILGVPTGQSRAQVSWRHLLFLCGKWPSFLPSPTYHSPTLSRSFSLSWVTFDLSILLPLAKVLSLWYGISSQVP